MRHGVQASLILAAVLGAGCLVDVRRVSDPGPAFREAREEAARVQGKPGPARSLNVLVYEADERKLVRVSLPIWLVKKIQHEVDDDDFDWDDDDVPARTGRRVRRHLRLEELEKAGLGLLVEVEEDDGARVLVWLR
jgi:hypothetical protein